MNGYSMVRSVRFAEVYGTSRCTAACSRAWPQFLFWCAVVGGRPLGCLAAWGANPRRPGSQSLAMGFTRRAAVCVDAVAGIGMHNPYSDKISCYRESRRALTRATPCSCVCRAVPAACLDCKGVTVCNCHAAQPSFALSLRCCQVSLPRHMSRDDEGKSSYLHERPTGAVAALVARCTGISGDG